MGSSINCKTIPFVKCVQGIWVFVDESHSTRPLVLGTNGFSHRGAVPICFVRRGGEVVIQDLDELNARRTKVLTTIPAETRLRDFSTNPSLNQRTLGSIFQDEQYYDGYLQPINGL